MRIVTTSLFLCFVCFAAIEAKTQEPSPARYAVKVVDEDGKPLVGVNVIGGFCTEESRLSGTTDSNGVFVLECKRAMSGEAGFSACHEMAGYYETHSGYVFTKIENGRWEPWDPVVTTVVRRVMNPIPMYAKRVETTIPALGEPLGFDLVQGDWVAPYGKGRVTDFAFQIKKRYVAFTDFDASFNLYVTNALDGFQQTSLKLFGFSRFRLLRNSPPDGYDMRALHLADSSTNYFKPDKDQSFYFRVRTVTNETGQITSALFGKVRGYIGFDVTRVKTGQMHFTYYLNPTPNDRNLEFDPTRNLFKDLKSTEQVREP